MLASRISCAIGAAIILFTLSAGCDRREGPSRTERRERLTFESLPPVELHLQLLTERVSHVDRYVSTLHGALRRFGEWFGPYPHAQLRVFERGWRDVRIVALQPGLIGVSSHWLAPTRSGTLEAALVRAVAGQFWDAYDATSPDAWLAEGLASYSAARALDEQFPDAHAYERRYFGDLVPYVIRSVPVQGPEARLSQLGLPVQAIRVALAFFTLERHLGWGTLQQALSAFAERRRSGKLEPEELFAILDHVSGRDLKWFVDEAFRSSKVFDYGIESLVSGPSNDSARYETSVVVRRYGDALFSGTSRPRTDPFHASGPVEVLVTFSDGHEAREHWDGRETTIQYDYESVSPAVTATVDPDRVLGLDENPSNNQRTLRETRHSAETWALRWSVWLQDALLTYAFFF